MIPEWELSDSANAFLDAYEDFLNHEAEEAGGEYQGGYISDESPAHFEENDGGDFSGLFI